MTPSIPSRKSFASLQSLAVWPISKEKRALLTEANQKCTGNPLMYNGKLCASTTKYADGNKGACGCGPADNNDQFEWNHSGFVAAANQALFDAGEASWCGESCGKCVKLTTTGGFVDGQGQATADGQSRIFMITNLCPNEAPNLSWCSQQGSVGVNQYGYGAHFDLENGANQISGMGWDNPEVTWEWTDCDGGHLEYSSTPNDDMYKTCQCGQTENEYKTMHISLY
ncbi:endoglucanase-like [Dreissena polymorpha]|uniref:endoglucanase-like n=1 Tax=Dreissena polymorpha TaxID=45954 RepID=UPI002264DA32|nr:endoglucanase-like [Dreissena polymorpha]